MPRLQSSLELLLPRQIDLCIELVGLGNAGVQNIVLEPIGLHLDLVTIHLEWVLAVSRVSWWWT